MANVGRPPKYKTVEELQNKIDEFFLNEPDKPTISGLAYHLGFTSRQSIYDYENSKNEQYSYILKKAVLFIEAIHEKGLHGNSNAGHIFWLKNRGWKDTQQVDQNSNITITDNSELGLP